MAIPIPDDVAGASPSPQLRPPLDPACRRLAAKLGRSGQDSRTTTPHAHLRRDRQGEGHTPRSHVSFTTRTRSLIGCRPALSAMLSRADRPVRVLQRGPERRAGSRPYRRTWRGDCDQRSSRSAADVPERSHPDRRLCASPEQGGPGQGATSQPRAQADVGSSGAERVLPHLRERAVAPEGAGRPVGALALPFLAEGDHLLVAAADEIPPHDDLLTERLTPENQDPRGLRRARLERESPRRPRAGTRSHPAGPRRRPRPGGRCRTGIRARGPRRA